MNNRCAETTPTAARKKRCATTIQTSKVDTSSSGPPKWPSFRDTSQCYRPRGGPGTRTSSQGRLACTCRRSKPSPPTTCPSRWSTKAFTTSRRVGLRIPRAPSIYILPTLEAKVYGYDLPTLGDCSRKLRLQMKKTSSRLSTGVRLAQKCFRGGKRLQYAPFAASV